MPVGAFVPSRIHLDYPEWQAPLIGNVGQVWAYDGTGYVPTSFLLASAVSAYGLTLASAADAAAARIALALGTSATLNVGTGANQIVQLDGSARLPAVDGSQLTGITAAAAEIDTELSDNHGDGSWEDTGAGLTAAQVWSYATRTLTALGSAAGVEFTYTVTDSATTNPIADVSVWFSTNSGITNVVWYGSTDAFGVARDANGNKPRLDAGTYFILCRKTGFSFTVDTETVS